MFYMEASKPEEKEKLKPGEKKKQKKIIVLMARSHPGESVSSIALKGFIEELINMESNLEAAYLRDNFTFLIFPMMNPDGVSIGNSRCSLSGNDLNQVWDKPDRFVHPEVFYSKRILIKIQKDHEILFFADFHGNYLKPGYFLHGSSLQLHGKAAKEMKELPFLLERNAPFFTRENTRLLAPTEKRDSASVVVSRELGVQHSYSIQLSGSQSADQFPLTPEMYNQFGRNLCKTLANLFSKKLGNVNTFNSEIKSVHGDEGSFRQHLGSNFQRRRIGGPICQTRFIKREHGIVHF